MIASPILSVLTKANADGDHRKSTGLDSETKRTLARQPLKRMKTSPSFSLQRTSLSMETNMPLPATNGQQNQADDFFFQPHPFSDLTMLVQGRFNARETRDLDRSICDPGRELFVDKSILSASSKVFRSYFHDENVDTIEILDVAPNEMIELLQFLYPQFQCTINNQNVTLLLILGRTRVMPLHRTRHPRLLAHRFEFDFISLACRSFILLYLSKLESIGEPGQGAELMEQEDGSRLLIGSMLDELCVWFREFALGNDQVACEAIRKKLVHCRVSNLLASATFQELEEKVQWRIFRARAKHLESDR